MPSQGEERTSRPNDGALVRARDGVTPAMVKEK